MYDLGSSVATSLCEGEAVEKHVALLEVRNTDFKITKKKLQTVRPFIHEDLILSDINLKAHKKEMSKAVEICVEEKVNELIQKAELLQTGKSWGF